jgi:RND family efflux transporter MFP subunit
MLLNDAQNSQQIPVAKTQRSTNTVRWFLVVPAVLLVCGVVMFVVRSRESHALAAGTIANVPEPVSVTYPAEYVMNGQISLPSTLQAYEDSPIYARTSGYVARWLVDIGARVRKGQLLAVISAPEVDQELNQARAMLSQTEANVTLAEVTTKRYRDLIHTNAVAQQELDANNQNLNAQRATLQAGQANVKRLEEMQAFEQVTAPFDGVVTQRLVNEGDLVNAGNGGNGAQLFHIAEISTMRVFIPVPENLGGEIRPGLKAQLSLIEFPQRTFTGVVVRTNHAIDPGSHTLLTEVDVPNPAGELMPGAYANVQLGLVHGQQQLTVPTGAVLFQAAGPQVVVVNAKNQLELRKVSIGNDLGNTIEITAGLSPSDRIVSSPPDYVVNGMPASIQSQTGSAPPANSTPNSASTSAAENSSGPRNVRKEQ